MEKKVLNYWEEDSYIGAIQKVKEISLDEVNEALENIKYDDQIEIISIRKVVDGIYGKINFKYENEIYEIYFYPSNFTSELSNMWKILNPSEQEQQDLKESKKCVMFFMRFGRNSKKCYKAQLRIILAMLPNTVVLFDESAEKAILIDYAKMLIYSKYEVSYKDLYTIQLVTYDDQIWIHTHGLNRLGITELEILKSNKEHCNKHCQLLRAYVSILLDNYKNGNVFNSSYCIGFLYNKTPIILTHKIWTEALKEYGDLKIGGQNDRIDTHNTETSPIFIYKSKENCINNIISKITDYDSIIENNPIVYYSAEESNNMRYLAQERLNKLDSTIIKNANRIMIKIAIYNNQGNVENTWGNVIEIDENKIKLKIVQDCYSIESIRAGSIIETRKENISDWYILYNNEYITPEKAYLYINKEN